MLALLAAVMVASTSGAPVRSAPQGTDGIVSLGMQYRDAAAAHPKVLNPFAYPIVGFTMSSPAYVLQLDSPLPILLPDGIAAAIRFLSSGDDDIPLWYALNGSREPGVIVIGEGAGRVVLANDDFTAVELGGTMRFSGFQILLPDDQRLPVQPAFFGLQGGLRAGFPGGGPVLRGLVHAGNAWTAYANVNPAFGFATRSTFFATDRFGVEVGGDLFLQHLDLREYRDVVTQERLAGRDWYLVWAIDARLVYRFDL